MCGIAGQLGSRENEVRASLAEMKHRGPDATRVWSGDGFTLGHNRLSIIDLDHRSDQPFFDPSGTIGVVYNGEIYNYRALRNELQAVGKYQFRTESDTEVLIYAYQEWGGKMVDHLQGMYAFGLIDRSCERVLLVTDQAAIKPLFYLASNDSFMFASELKGITKLMHESGIPVEVDREALDLYWALGYVPAPRTLFANVSRMRPRSVVSYDLRTGALTSLEYELPPAKPLQDEVFKALLERKIEEHLIADVPVGLFFSGGTDSSLIASALKTKNVDLEGFCVQIEDRPEDGEYAKAIAEELDFKLTTTRFGPREFDSVYDEVMELIDEPVSDSSLFPTYFVAREASKKVKVVLSGEGGDEYFFGYPRSRELNKLQHVVLDVRAGFLERVFFLLPRFRGKNKLFERLFVLFRRPLAFYLLTMSPTKSLLTLRQWEAAKVATSQIVRAPRYLDADLYLPHVLLRKTDMATMFCSLEGRVPLLDREVIAAAVATPQTLTPSEPLKPLLKRILASYLPKELVYRKKTGFGLRTPAFFSNSEKLRTELPVAVAYLNERGFMPFALPKQETLLASYPALVWQILMLYRACRAALP